MLGGEVPGTRLVSCDLLIVVDEAGESVASAHASDVGSWSFRERVEARLAPGRCLDTGTGTATTGRHRRWPSLRAPRAGHTPSGTAAAARPSRGHAHPACQPTTPTPAIAGRDHPARSSGYLPASRLTGQLARTRPRSLHQTRGGSAEVYGISAGGSTHRSVDYGMKVSGGRGKRLVPGVGEPGPGSASLAFFREGEPSLQLIGGALKRIFESAERPSALNGHRQSVGLLSSRC
jgi:hypothetical protein